MKRHILGITAIAAISLGAMASASDAATIATGTETTETSGKEVTKEKALKFLYSGMSLPDKADYTADFYEANVEAALRARREMPWGASVPEREFLHFVVPVRVNNENLDDSRMVFYEELKPRVERLSMKDAILAVNHWCHEKVTYKPSDGRTSSPLSSVSQAIGRCGEESTFTVAALRSVGIPARQIYTPRWAHTDDNHAWVEAWADGQWYFIGACEPEPILNLAWFNDPASRGLLMSTNVWGDYRGPEEVLQKQPLTTRINVTANYAPTGTLPVRVVNADGTPAPGATVNFCIYNYAEYYPAVTRQADAGGRASLTSGLGDVVVWASDGKRFGIAKGNPAEFSEGGALEVVLDKDGDYAGSFEMDIIPPASGATLPSPTAGQRALNDLMLQREDSIRNAYIATFASDAEARAIARRLGLDEGQMARLLTEARGNHRAITGFLEGLAPAQRQAALKMLLDVSEKDRRDIGMEVVADQLCGDNAGCEVDGKEYLLNPRVELEYLRPWRRILSDAFATDAEAFRKNPGLLVEWVKNNIADASADNPIGLRMSPAAVYKERKADALSRSIFFVAAARSVGVPARIDPVTEKTEFLTEGKSWKEADFGTRDLREEAPKGRLALSYHPSGSVVDPKYYSQFSISKIEGGMPRLLEFDEDGTLSTLFAKPYELEAGQYIITTGQRLADGGVLARSEVFAIQPGATANRELIIRRDSTRLSVIGSLNAENIYRDLAAGIDKSLLSTTGRGYYILGLIEPNHEPSAHALNDISAMAKALEASGRKIMLLFSDESKAQRFRQEMYPNLPSNVVLGIDNNGVSRKEIIESLHLENPGNPIFVVADTFNRIVWVSTGYTIGLGEQLNHVLHTLN